LRAVKVEVCFKPIGYVETPYSDEEVKSSFHGVNGRVVVLEEYASGLKGLAGFSHVILIAYLHKVTEEQRKVLVVRPRRLVRLGFKLEELPKIGVFASDSPHRPNPIALSIVRLKEVRGNVLEVSGLDLFNGTPILDIKPYTASKRVEKPIYPNWYIELYRRVGVEI